MKTTIDIRDDLLSKARKLGSFSTKRETVNHCLGEFIRLKSIDRLRSKLGKMSLTMGVEDLERMRADENR